LRDRPSFFLHKSGALNLRPRLDLVVTKFSPPSPALKHKSFKRYTPPSLLFPLPNLNRKLHILHYLPVILPPFHFHQRKLPPNLLLPRLVPLLFLFPICLTSGPPSGVRKPSLHFDLRNGNRPFCSPNSPLFSAPESSLVFHPFPIWNKASHEPAPQFLSAGLRSRVSASTPPICHCSPSLSSRQVLLLPCWGITNPFRKIKTICSPQSAISGGAPRRQPTPFSEAKEDCGPQFFGKAPVSRLFPKDTSSPINN